MKRKLIFSAFIYVLVLLASLTGNAFAQTLAFPGAEGAGKFVTGGRGSGVFGTTVFEVTNLTDNNTAGSLRYALSQSATSYPYRTIIFRVSGTIRLTKGLDIPANTTLAGQTAPGDGICIADYPVYIKGDNVIIRYMRFRMGDRYQNKGKVAGGGSDDALGSTGASKLIIDHCSVSWSTDEALTVYRGDSLTMQWNLISEPLNYSYHFEEQDTDFEQHGYGGIWGAVNGSFHHNLIAHCRNRTPRFAIGSPWENPVFEKCDFRNNVLYNWGINNIYGGEAGHYNVVNNYFKYGPNTSSSRKYQIVNVDSVADTPWAIYYLKGNYVDGSTANTNSNYLGVGMGNWTLKDTGKFKASIPFDLPDLNGETAQNAYTNVLAKVGCSFPKRDTLDERIVNDVKNRTGKIIDVQGGYPHGTDYTISYVAWPLLNTVTAPTDTDHDGMPDAWETANGLNPNNAADRNYKNTLGYSNLEVYINTLITGDNPVNPVYGGVTITAPGGGPTPATGDAASATWILTANTSVTVSGDIVGTAQVAHANMAAGYASFTSTAGEYANQTVSAQRIKPVAGWPANQTGPDVTQYVEYAVAPAAGKIFQLDSLQFDFGDAGSTNTMKVNIYYSLDGFATAGTLINPDPLVLPKYTASGEFVRAQYSGLNITAGSGKTLSVRVYPWWPSGASSTKYLIERNIRVTGYTQSVLPLQLLSFAARENTGGSKAVTLQWLTTGEYNTSHFLIERSADGNVFETIGRVKANNQTGQQAYLYNDDFKQAGTVYYRLKMVDIDGHYTFSNLVSINRAAQATLLLWPNPVNDKLTVTVQGTAAKSTLTIVNTNGAVVVSQIVPAGNTKAIIGVDGLPGGTYLLIYQSEGQRVTERFVIAR